MPIPFDTNPYAYYPGWSGVDFTGWSGGNITQSNSLACYIVHGTEEANRYTVPLNSTVMLMDYNSAMFWIKKCDSVGQVTLTAYTFQEYTQNSQSNDMQTILDRLSKLEAKLNESNISTD